MPRYILIEGNSGTVWGDTARLDGPPREETPLEAARRLDAHIGLHYECEYEDCGPAGGIDHDEDGYYVYVADPEGEAIPFNYDGADREFLDMLEERCELVAVVITIKKEEGDRW